MKTLTSLSLSLLCLLSTGATALAQTAASSAAPKGPAAQPVGTTGAAAAPARIPATSTDYRLVPGDKLRVEVYKDPQLSQSVQVRPDGKITLPLANDITAA